MKRKAVTAVIVIAALVLIAGVLASAVRSSEAYRRRRAAEQPAESPTASGEAYEIPGGSLKDYSENEDGTWECEGYTYKYKFELSGKVPNSNAVTTFVYLSNLEGISFEQAWKAAGLSSDTGDYFDIKDAVLVEWNGERRLY